MLTLRFSLTVPKQFGLIQITHGNGISGLTKHVLHRMHPLSAPKTGGQMPSSFCLDGKEESMKQLSILTLTPSPEAN